MNLLLMHHWNGTDKRVMHGTSNGTSLPWMHHWDATMWDDTKKVSDALSTEQRGLLLMHHRNGTDKQVMHDLPNGTSLLWMHHWDATMQDDTKKASDALLTE
jgi:hypothetical protein